ncbi:ISAtfe-like protein, partial [Acidithiobacillus sp. GGI-221]
GAAVAGGPCDLFGLEGFNSLLQSAKSKARGYRTRKNFINMAYLILGKLDFQLPT